jgi:hypothetical protein
MGFISRKKNSIAFLLAVISAVFLFISGTTGVADWMKVENTVLKYAHLPFINTLFILVSIVASFGGLAVLTGGIFILKRKVILGNILIMLGSGAGLLGFLVNLFILLISFKFSIYSYLSFSSLGVLFAIFAQLVSNKKKKR